MFNEYSKEPFREGETRDVTILVRVFKWRQSSYPISDIVTVRVYLTMLGRLGEAPSPIITMAIPGVSRNAKQSSSRHKHSLKHEKLHEQGWVRWNMDAKMWI